MYLMIVYIYIYIDIQYPLFISKSMYMNIFVNYISTFKREKGVYVYYISIYNIIIIICIAVAIIINKNLYYNTTT